MHVLARELQAKHLATSIISDKGATAAQIQARLEQAGGLARHTGDPASLLRALWYDAGVRRLVLLCDNAETLPAETFQYVSSIRQLCITQPLTLQLVLIGEATVWPGLANQASDALRAATSTSYATLSMRLDEATAYLEHRLVQAGQTLDSVMTPSAVVALCEQAHGNARQLDAPVAAGAYVCLQSRATSV